MLRAPALVSRCSIRPRARPSRSWWSAWKRSRPRSSRNSRLISWQRWAFRTRPSRTCICARWCSCRPPRPPRRAHGRARAAPVPDARLAAVGPDPGDLDVRVRKRRLAALDVVEQRFVHRRIERRRFVLLELALPQGVGALRHVLAAFRFPLLDAVVVGERRAVERRLEVRLCVRAAEEMLAG